MESFLGWTWAASFIPESNFLSKFSSSIFWQELKRLLIEPWVAYLIDWNMQFLQHVSYLHRSSVLPHASHSLHTYSVNIPICQCINLSVIYFQLGKFLWKLTAPRRINYTQFEVHNPKCATLPSYLPFSNLAIKIFGFSLQLQSTGFFPKLRFLENSAQKICWVESFCAWFAKENTYVFYHEKMGLISDQ